MAFLSKPVKLVAHQHTNLSLSLRDEAGKCFFVEFSDGYAEVQDAHILEQLFDSPLRGPGKPSEFMICASDDAISKMISGVKDEGEPERATPYSEMTLPEALTDIFHQRKFAILGFDEVMQKLKFGGYVSRSKNLPQIVRGAIRKLVDEGVLVGRGNDWQSNS